MVFRQAFIFSSLALSAVLIVAGTFWPDINWAWLVVGPLMALGVHDLAQSKHTLLRIYPIIGHLRYLFESVRRELQQYFVESDLDGAPVNRECRSCNTDKCPTGITTQNPARYKQLDVTDKGVRVANFHHSSMETLAELLSILGKDQLKDLDPADINRRVNQGNVMNYSQLYPRIDEGCLLHTDCAPEEWASDWHQATAYSWR